MTASHEERETYDPRSLKAPVATQDGPDRSAGVKATGTGSAEWHPARGAGADDWLDASHAYATLSAESRVGSPQRGADAHDRQTPVTSDAPNLTASLLEEVTKRVMATDYIDASRVRIVEQEGRVTLTGTAPDERSRTQIEQLVAGCDGVKGIDNQLRVERAAGDR
ncbi:MAG: BON domain-containing protein [Janthinobacterium lividum]